MIKLNRALSSSNNNDVYHKKVFARNFENKVRSLRVSHHNSLRYSGEINFTYLRGRLNPKEIKTDTKVKFYKSLLTEKMDYYFKVISIK